MEAGKELATLGFTKLHIGVLTANLPATTPSSPRRSDHFSGVVVVDWEDLGPAEPARELASTLVSCFHDGDPDLASMRRAYRSYVAAGGPARLRSTADFTMLIATRLNFLNLQVRVALDPTTLPRDRKWAEFEIDQGLRILPTADLTAAVLDALEARLRTDEQLPPPR